MKTKFLSLFLSLIMVLSCFGAALPAFAEEAAGGETETTDYDALAVAAGYVARIGTPEEAYADGAMTGYYKNLAANQKGYVADEDAEYASAHDAAKTLGKDTVVYLLTDLVFTNILKMDAEYTLDGQGHCISGQYHQKIVDIQSTEGNGVTIKNLKIWQQGRHGCVQVTGQGAKGTLENCYLLGTGVTTGGIIVNDMNQSITVKGCTIKIIDPAPVTPLGHPGDAGLRLAYDNQTAVLENTVIDCSENFGGTGVHARNNGAQANTDDGQFDNTNHNSITMTNCVVIAPGAAIDAKDTNITLNGGTFITLLGASASASAKELVFDGEGNPVWEQGAKNDDGTWKDTVDADGNKLDENGNKIQAKQTIKVLKGDPRTNQAAGESMKEYTAFEGSAIMKGRGGNFTVTGTVRFEGGVAGLTFNKDDLANGENPDGTTTATVQNLTYEIGKTSLIYSDEAEAAQIAAGAVAYTFNEDGTKTYYKNLTNKDKDYAEADGDAVSAAAGKTIYLIADIQMKDDANRASDFAVNTDTVINGMGYSIYMAGYFCAKAGKSFTLSNATLYQNANTTRVMVQTDAGSTATLNNVTLITNSALANGFFCVRGDLNLDGVTLKLGETGSATYLMHADGTGMTVNMNNLTADFGAVAGVQGFTTGAGATLNFTGNTFVNLTGYGLRNGAGEGVIVNITDNAVFQSSDNAVTPYGNKSVINVSGNAQVISTTKDAIKAFGHDVKVNISDNAKVVGGRYAIATDWENNTEKDYGKNALITLGANVTVTLTETAKSAAAVWVNGRGATVVTNATINSTGAFPAIKVTAEGASVLVKGGTVNGTVAVETGAVNIFDGTIDAGSATTEAIVVATGAMVNIYEGTVKGGAAPITGETYAAETTEKVYNRMSSNVPTNGEISLRMNAESEGMRFASSVSKEVNDFAKAMLDAGAIADYQFGTLIVRKTELANKEFTVEAFAAADVPYAAITADSGLVVNDDGSLSYTAAIVNFKTDNYGTTLIARAYIAYTLTDGSVLYFYAEEAEDGTSLAKLAEKALADVKMESEEGYRNFVTSYYKENAQGKLKPYTGNAYAPYSKAQQALLNAYIAEA